MFNRADVLISMIRIEIVIDDDKLGDMIALLRTAGVRGYTFMRHGGGLGSRGERRPDDIALEERNAVLILACEEKQAERLVMAIRPKLKEYGGMCLISDCKWIIGPAASY